MRTHPANPASTSPAEWAEAFIDFVANFPNEAISPMLLMAWFHNALEAGYNCSERGEQLSTD